MYRLGWFSTGRGPGSRNLLTAMQNAIRDGEVKAEIAFVFLSREPGEAEGSDRFIELVRGYGIPLVCRSYRKFKAVHGQSGDAADASGLPSWRADYDREAMAALAGYPVDLAVLAGYMLIVGSEMCRRYDMLNLHPAAPDGPKGTWMEVIRELITQKAERSGVMMHLATPELDRGPVVSYCRYPIRGDAFDPLWRDFRGGTVAEVEQSPLFKEIRRAGMARELPLVVATVKAFSEGRVVINPVVINPDKSVADADGRAISGYDLTAEIEDSVAAPAGSRFPCPPAYFPSPPLFVFSPPLPR